MDYTSYSYDVPALSGASSARAETIRDTFGLYGQAGRQSILEGVKVPTAGITLITGYSGAGKSTLLALVKARRPDAATLPEVLDPDRPIIDLLGSDEAAAVHALSKVGLAEARVFVTPYRHLSDGQKFRLRLALLLEQRPRCVVVDEFLSTLDRLTARIVAYNFQKACRRAGVDAYLATAHGDLTEALAPDHVLTVDFAGRSRLVPADGRPARVGELDEVEVSEGAPEDYRDLCRFHYANVDNDLIGWATRMSQIRVARFRGDVVGISLFMPPCSEQQARHPFFRTLNQRLIHRFRTVVHPAFRGLGLFKRLEPVLPAGGVIVGATAMGRYFPYQLSMGYQEFTHPRSVRQAGHDELEAFLHARGVAAVRDFHQVPVARAFYLGLPAGERRALRDIVTRILLRDNVEYLVVLAGLARLPHPPAALRAELTGFYRRLLGEVSDEVLGAMMTEALYFPMAGLYKDCAPAAEIAGAVAA